VPIPSLFPLPFFLTRVKKAVPFPTCSSTVFLFPFPYGCESSYIEWEHISSSTPPPFRSKLPFPPFFSPHSRQFKSIILEMQDFDWLPLLPPSTVTARFLSSFSSLPPFCTRLATRGEKRGWIITFLPPFPHGKPRRFFLPLRREYVDREAVYRSFFPPRKK